MSLTLPAMNKNDDIEILRAVAILFTLILHLKLIQPSSYDHFGWFFGNFDLSIGVDLFFVISGYVIANSLKASVKPGSHSRATLILSFWIKRIYRLLPAAWLWLLVAVVFYIGTSQLDEHIKQLIAAALNVMNLYTAYCVNNPSETFFCAETVHMNSHYWSLSLEEQFYLLFPLLFFFLNRKLFLLLLMTAILLQLFWQRPFFTFGWFLKTDGLCWGVLLSFLSSSAIYKRPGNWLQKNRRSALLFFFVLVGLLPVVSANTQGLGNAAKPYGVGLIAFLSAILVWIASYNHNLFGNSIRYKKVMLYLGSRSYALYLSHLVIFMILDNSRVRLIPQFESPLQEHLVVALIVCIAISLSLLASELTYRYVELPFRNRGRGISRTVLAKHTL